MMSCDEFQALASYLTKNGMPSQLFSNKFYFFSEQLFCRALVIGIFCMKKS